MGYKKPEEFIVGDTIKNTSSTPYSGSVMTKVEPYGENQTQVTFANGEKVEFFNGFYHEMKD